MNYLGTALDYAYRVVDGEIDACTQVVEACQRQIDDLDSPPGDWVFSEFHANRVCKFVELLPHTKGKWAGKPIKLEPWQVFILTTVFGWVDETGNRRFKTVYIEVPRKNAKSTLSSAVALYCLALDGEGGAEVYSAATTRDQARIVFQDAKRMAENCGGIQKRFGVKTSAHSVYVEKSASSFKALSRDQGGNLDGLNVHCAVIDELHAHKTRDVFDVIETATGAREQPLIWLITTAGFNRSGICYEQRAYAKKVLNKSTEDHEYFGIVYTLDEDDDPFTPESWAKCNPNWGVSVNPDDLERKARKALEMASARNNFLTKHCNVWVNAAESWLNAEHWRKQVTDLTVDDFEGEPSYIGLDLATRMDIAARVSVFVRDIDGQRHYYLFPTFYLPEDALAHSKNAKLYAGWADQGFLNLIDGAEIDLNAIEEEILDLAGKQRVEEVVYDPWQATQLAQSLRAEQVLAVEYRNTVGNMSPPMREFEGALAAGRLWHPDNPVFNWMASNVVAKEDAKENIFPRKEFPENKIDGIVAALFAMGRAMVAEPEVASPWEDDNFSILG